MKSKNVQMRINPELYAQLKRVDGDSNNERMSKLLDDSQEKYRLAESCDLKNSTIGNLVVRLRRETNLKRNLASALVVSIAVSVCSVAYVCMVNGWFL